MIWLYDNAIVEDLTNSFAEGLGTKPVVRVFDSENFIGIVAQEQKDHIQFPIVGLIRDEESIDNDRYNFSAAHHGVAAGINNANNHLAFERVLPMTLSYNLSLITTSVTDMDELVKEILFKYVDMYFLQIKLPYELDRTIRFGIQITPGQDFKPTSSSSEYTSNGKLYETIIHLDCRGVVQIHYNQKHLTQFEMHTSLESNKILSKP